MFKKNDWTCSQCAFDNFASRSECKNCGCFRSKSGSKKGDWTCPLDKELNFASRSTCRKCGSKNPSDNSETKGKPGDWTCAIDNELNFASRTSCRKCGSKKPNSITGIGGNESEQKIKPGDWYCNVDSCKILNFGSRSECFGCGASKVNNQTTNVDDKDESCIVCFERQTDTVITKCGHLGYCGICALSMKQCPICRISYDPSKDLLKIFKVI